MNFLIFTASYILISISVIGYGLIFNTTIFKYQKRINFGYAGILGIFILMIYSYISSFFISHNIYHNTLIILVGILFFCLNFIRNFKINKSNYLILLLVFSTLFIANLAFKTNEDFPYYHFNYTMLLVEGSLPFGIGIFNHGFRTPSSLFYLNSLFYLPFIKFYSFQMTAILIMGLCNFVLLRKIFNFTKKNKLNFINYLTLLSFTFINVVFYRIAEHGTDRSAQILIFVLIIELLILVNFFSIKTYKKNFCRILLLIAITISLKAFYILYLVFVFYALFFLYKKIKLLKIIQDNLILLLSFGILIFLVLLTNLQNSGCLLYPVKFTCLGELPWAFSEEELKQMSIHYENWAKAGAGPGFRVMDAETYIQNFNWVGNWMKLYFQEKGLNTTGGILSIALITIFIFYSKTKKIDKKNKFKFILFIIFLLFIEWFWKHPAFRYGGFCLLALLIFFPTSLMIERYYHKTFNTRVIALVILTTLIFVSRNISRISSEIEKYDYQPIKTVFYYVNTDGNENYFVQNKIIYNLINAFNECNKKQNNTKYNCDLINKKIGTAYNKYFFKKN